MKEEEELNIMMTDFGKITSTFDINIDEKIIEMFEENEFIINT